MDTISRENNSMLPVGGIIVGVIALLLGGYAAISLSKVNKALADHQPKIDKIDSVELAANSAAAAAEKTSKDVQTLQRSTQDAFTQVGGALGELRTSITKLEESAKKPVAVANSKKGGGPVEAGPGEYVVKAGDTGMKIANANHVAMADLTAVNPGVNWSGLKVGQKVKLPKK
ncbi:MAG TPA: LysM domain-containing protein [Opitutaceae bacterium]|nr:LysM domain-containing protein [Opitutaceae bacterium]